MELGSIPNSAIGFLRFAFFFAGLGCALLVANCNLQVLYISFLADAKVKSHILPRLYIQSINLFGGHALPDLEAANPRGQQGAAAGTTIDAVTALLRQQQQIGSRKGNGPN